MDTTQQQVLHVLIPSFPRCERQMPQHRNFKTDFPVLWTKLSTKKDCSDPGFWSGGPRSGVGRQVGTQSYFRPASNRSKRNNIPCWKINEKCMIVTVCWGLGPFATLSCVFVPLLSKSKKGNANWGHLVYLSVDQVLFWKCQMITLKGHGEHSWFAQYIHCSLLEGTVFQADDPWRESWNLHWWESVPFQNSRTDNAFHLRWMFFTHMRPWCQQWNKPEAENGIFRTDAEGTIRDVPGCRDDSFCSGAVHLTRAHCNRRLRSFSRQRGDSCTTHSQTQPHWQVINRSFLTN